MAWSVLTWNVLFGGEDRFDRVLALLASVKPDVAVLQECLQWEDGVRLSQAQEALGVKNAVLGLARPRGSGRRFHVAVLSRFAITRTVTHADPAAVGHVILEAAIAAPGGALTLFGTHFDSHGEDERLRDARTACALVPRVRLETERVLLAGDLNALSRRDPYPADLADRLRRAGTDKYGDPPRFEVMDLLEAHGWIDLLRHRGEPPSWITAARDRGGVHIDYRTDYLLASPSLAVSLQSCRVLACDGASDHEPVLASFG